MNIFDKKWVKFWVWILHIYLFNDIQVHGDNENLFNVYAFIKLKKNILNDIIKLRSLIILEYYITNPLYLI